MAQDVEVLQFTEDWLRLGVVTPAQVEAYMDAYAADEDPHPEHFRWRAFCTFLKAHRPLSAPLAWALYSLGERDPDVSMGGSMMADIIQLSECPADLLATALTSDRKHVRVVAGRRGRQ